MNTKTEEVYIMIDSKKYPWDKLVELEVNVFAFRNRIEIRAVSFQEVEGVEKLIETKLAVTVESFIWAILYDCVAALHKRSDALLFKMMTNEFGKDENQSMVSYRLINLFNFLDGKDVSTITNERLEVNNSIIITGLEGEPLYIPGNDINFQKFIDFSKNVAVPFKRPVGGWKI